MSARGNLSYTLSHTYASGVIAVSVGYTRSRRMAEWQKAVSSGDAAELSELVCAFACSTEQALGLVRGCVEVLEKKVASAGESFFLCSDISIPACA